MRSVFEDLDLGSMPPEQIALVIGQIRQMMMQAPWVTRVAQGRFQKAIDAWDVELAIAARSDLMEYLDSWHAAVGSVNARERGVAELLPLDVHGMALVRQIDIGAIAEQREYLAKNHLASVHSLLRTLRIDWINGLPLERACAPLGEVADDPDEIMERVTVATDALVETLRGPRPELNAMQILGRLDGRLRMQGAEVMDTDDIPDRHVLYEFFAHRFAYNPDHPAIFTILRNSGYRDEFLPYRTQTGLNFFVLEPRGGCDGRPVVVFSGTEPDDLKDIKTDLEFQIGADHFQSAESLGLSAILRALKVTHGQRPDVTGHSLGGALAQLAALTWPDLVGDVVTFQAPGLTRLNAARGTKGRAEHAPDFGVHHYVGDSDIVHKAGQRHLPGRTILVTGVHVDRGDEPVYGMGHTDMLLAGADQSDRLARMCLTQHAQPHTYCRRAVLADHPTTTGSLHEAVRASVAISLEFVELAMSKNGRQALDARGPDLIAHALGVEGTTRSELIRRVTWRAVREGPRVAVAASRALWQAALLQQRA